MVKRERWSLLVLTGMLGACAWGNGVSRAPSPALISRSLQPVLTLAGARLALPDGTGLPLPHFAPAPYTRFISPVAAAAGGPDYYVADAGASRIYRYDPAMDAMTVVPGIAARTDTRLFVGPDLSLFVVEPGARRVGRYSRDGRLLAAYADVLNLAHPVAAAWDERRGRLLVADRIYNQLMAFQGVGRAAYVIALRGDERHGVRSIADIAIGARGIYLSDPVCRCIAVATDDGRVVATFGHNVIGQPGALAVDDHERIYVADVFTHTIRIFSGVRETEQIPASALGMVQVSDLSTQRDMLVVADAAGAKVMVLRLAPPAAGGGD